MSKTTTHKISGLGSEFMLVFQPHVVTVLNGKDDNKNEISRDVAIALALALYKVVDRSTINDLVGAIVDAANGSLSRLQIVPRTASAFNIQNFVMGLLSEGTFSLDQQQELALALVKYFNGSAHIDGEWMEAEVKKIASYLELKGNEVALKVRGSLVLALFKIKPADGLLKKVNIPPFVDEVRRESGQPGFPEQLAFVPSIVEHLAQGASLSSDVRRQLACALLPHEPAPIPDLPVATVYGLADCPLTVRPLSEGTAGLVHTAFSRWMDLLDYPLKDVRPSDYHRCLAINTLDTMIATMREVALCLMTQPYPRNAYHALHFLGCLPPNIGGGMDGLNSFPGNRDFLAFRLLLIRYVWWQINNNWKMPHETYLYLHRIFELAIADTSFTSTEDYKLLEADVYNDWGEAQLIGMQTLLERQANNINTLLVESV